MVLDVTSSSLDLKAKSSTSEEEYDLHIDFFKEIDVSSIHKTITGSHIFFILVKKDLDEEFWPRLTKEKVKYRNIRTDFDRWVDEDEQDEQDPADELAGMGGMPGMPGMGGMGGMPGMPGMGGMGGMGGIPGMENLDMAALMKQFGGAAPGNENDFSSSGDEEEGDEEEHGHSHTHDHDHDHDHDGHSHSH